MMYRAISSVLRTANTESLYFRKAAFYGKSGIETGSYGIFNKIAIR